MPLFLCHPLADIGRACSVGGCPAEIGRLPMLRRICKFFPRIWSFLPRSYMIVSTIFSRGIAVFVIGVSRCQAMLAGELLMFILLCWKDRAVWRTLQRQPMLSSLWSSSCMDRLETQSCQCQRSFWRSRSSTTRAGQTVLSRPAHS